MFPWKRYSSSPWVGKVKRLSSRKQHYWFKRQLCFFKYSMLFSSCVWACSTPTPTLRLLSFTVLKIVFDPNNNNQTSNTHSTKGHIKPTSERDDVFKHWELEKGYFWSHSIYMIHLKYMQCVQATSWYLVESSVNQLWKVLESYRANLRQAKLKINVTSASFVPCSWFRTGNKMIRANLLQSLGLNDCVCSRFVIEYILYSIMAVPCTAQLANET